MEGSPSSDVDMRLVRSAGWLEAACAIIPGRTDALCTYSYLFLVSSWLPLPPRMLRNKKNTVIAIALSVMPTNAAAQRRWGR
jgi:hypothetical protein